MPLMKLVKLLPFAKPNPWNILFIFQLQFLCTLSACAFSNSFNIIAKTIQEEIANKKKSYESSKIGKLCKYYAIGQQKQTRSNHKENSLLRSLQEMSNPTCSEQDLVCLVVLSSDLAPQLSSSVSCFHLSCLYLLKKKPRMMIEAPLTLTNLSLLKSSVHGRESTRRTEESEPQPRPRQHPKFCNF